MKSLSYDEVALVPELAIVESRSSCDTSVDFLGYKFKLPIMPANMKCSIDIERAEWCKDNGIFYALHRFQPYEDVFNWLHKFPNKKRPSSISIGIQDEDLTFIFNCIKGGKHIDFITIDVAHAHCLKMRTFLADLHELYLLSSTVRHRPKIIVGNVATPEAVEDLERWGADAVKVGVGQGHVCTTRLQTGFGVPMFTCVADCVGNHTEPLQVKIIADGGISHHGDVAKALVAGADMVMAGSIFARCWDSPAETFHGEDGVEYKRWFGSASEENKGHNQYVEGICVVEPAHPSYREMLDQLGQGLRSAISYAGGKNLDAFKSVVWRQV